MLFNDIRTIVLNVLKRNIYLQQYIPETGYPSYIEHNGFKTFMPAYIPYVGENYFVHRPRILCYAINQNLSPYSKWSITWMKEWASIPDKAVDRLNSAARAGRAIPIKPYADGCIPLAAILSLFTPPGGNVLDQFEFIDTVIAVTNFVKFSTSNTASSEAIPKSWWDECGSRFVIPEIKLLCPDIIIAFGNITFLNVNKMILDMGNDRSLFSGKIYFCKFPARIPSYKTCPVTGEDKILWTDGILPLVENIYSPRESFTEMRMTRFPSYFVKIAKDWNIERELFC